MQATSTDRTRATPNWPIPQLFPLWDGWAPVASEWQHWNERVGATYGAMSTEWMDFVRRRIAEDMAFQQDIAACRSMGDLWRVYARFLETMANDYQGEMMKLSQLGVALAETSTVESGERASQGSEKATA